MKTRTPDLLGMSYACANMVHSPGYADDLRQYTTLNSNEGSDDDDDDDDKKEENDREGCRTRSGNTRTIIKEFGQG